MKRIILIGLAFLNFSANGQLSISSDLSVVRQSGETKSFWSLAQTVKPSYGITRHFSVYASVAYTNPDRTINRFTTNALVDTIVPQKIRYTTTTSWTTRQFAAGVKMYFVGGHNSEQGLSLYGSAGAGIMSVKINTQTSIGIDTSNYQALYPFPGEEPVNSLSYDVGLGIEKQMGGNFFWYLESKAWIPTEGVTSPYLLTPNKVTAVMFGGGIRVLFGGYK